jgi:hypothetical protein
MTALEAIPKITELLGLLIKRMRDRETFALVQQIQEHQLVVHQGLMSAQAEILELKRKMGEMERDHEKAIAERDVEIAKLKAQPERSSVERVRLPDPRRKFDGLL